ncbi:MAG: preprotein translocase, YajC subunit [Chlorobi bacterium]|nr:preprotein translocase, YajC subunit [Chlorobiota bacterium]
MDFTFLLAQAGGGAGGIGGTAIMFAAIIGIFFFMIIRPQQKRMKEHQALLSGVKRGDKVVLSNGMHGSVYEVEEKTILVEISKNTVVKFEKGSIQSIVPPATT